MPLEHSEQLQIMKFVQVYEVDSDSTWILLWKLL